MAEAPRGIQATLFDYFQDTEYFSIEEAKELVVDHQNRDVNRESIRARIYEGIDKGLFERVGKGLYTVTRQDEQGRENTCLLINGNGRDLSFLEDNSIDAIITDHPYDTSKSLKGGNRDFANYELFKYDQNDMAEKFRVLKPGHFLVEFLPEENGDNYEYLFQVKDMARAAGFEYYAKVPWKKGDFVANTGRKSKNTEDVVFFSKGRARELRHNAKNEKEYQESRTVVEFKEFVPGSKTIHSRDMGSMMTSYETKLEPLDVNIRISVAKEDKEKVKALLEKAWDDISTLIFDKSPLDKDYGGKYTDDELFDMPAQLYMLEYLEASGISFVDLSPGPENIFEADTEVIVNPTNLMGPMGAGLAKEFKERYPGIEDIYKESCRQRQQSGTDGFRSPAGANEILTSESRAMFEGNLFLIGPTAKDPAILCFPTKRHWKDGSDLALIEAGLETFVRNYKHSNIKSITFPKLGCGLGGLNWDKQVKPLMQKHLADLPDIDIKICGDTLREDKKDFYMSGAAGMLPTTFDVAAVGRKEKIHKAEKPVDLLKQILQFVTKEGELTLDQFGGSAVLGEAALETGRNAIIIEKDIETYNKACERIAALGNVEVMNSTQRVAINVAIDALEAAQEGPECLEAFAKHQNEHGMLLPDAIEVIENLQGNPKFTEDAALQDALCAGAQALEEAEAVDFIGKDALIDSQTAAYIEALDSIETDDPMGKFFLDVGKDAIIAKATFNQSRDRSVISEFMASRDFPDIAVLERAYYNLWHGHISEAQKEALNKAYYAYEEMDLRNAGLDLAQEPENARVQPETPSSKETPAPKVLECSSRGDKRFSALYAMVTINHKEKSIEEWYQDSKRTVDGKRAGKGKPFDHIIDPFTGDKLPAKEASWLYRGLWITYLSKNPVLVEYASQFDEFHDMFRSEKTFNCQADVIEAYVKGDRKRYVEVVQASEWYKNMARHKAKVKAARTAQQPLAEKIQDAKDREQEGISEQMSMFPSRSQRSR